MKGAKVSNKAKNEANASLERCLIERSWSDHAFGVLLQNNPRKALASIGVDVSPDVKIDVRQQRRDTLYLVIPPLAAPQDDTQPVINQMDLWQSGDLFCWIMPQDLKLELLRMRQSYRKSLNR
jgi:hypothetical protein